MYIFYLCKWEGVGENPTPLLNISIDVGGGESIPNRGSSSTAFLLPSEVQDGNNCWALAIVALTDAIKWTPDKTNK